MLLLRQMLLVLALSMLAGCAGSVTGNQVGLGLGNLDTITKEEKENEAWFDEFYGRPRPQ